jgi:hypothetical protein
MRSNVTPNELISAANRFKNSLNGVPANRIVWPHRWLAERWDLDYPPERKV